MPVSVAEKLEGYMRRSLWKGKINVKCLNKVSWDIVCARYPASGLNLRWLSLKNVGHLFKWVWRISSPDTNSLWKFYCVLKLGISICHSFRDNSLSIFHLFGRVLPRLALLMRTFGSFICLMSHLRCTMD